MHKLKTIKHDNDTFFNDLYILYEKLINKYKIDHSTTISTIVNILYSNIKHMSNNNEFICDSTEYKFLTMIIALATYSLNYDCDLYLYIT